ncbi:glutamate racemase [Aurantibacillus circumpalustris]|uniref:glutamate racemase n=1 Tax=Aurantibacillus circumpalustris TaxID=3036359 RepID=UPI00295A8D43|nr:glutamate racemase [Aurantibacillus circumpalustris]
MEEKKTYQPIGIFDSGFGGLTVLKEIVSELPQYDYIYLGDSARAPYGSRSFETVYEYALECVEHLFNMGCHLVVLACNTASAKALRTIQQKDLPKIAPSKRVLGVIRPTTEIIGKHSKTGHVGVLGTQGTVNSESYLVEIEKFFPELKVYQQACPMWVPLIENSEFDNEGAEFFIKKYVDELMAQQKNIDAVILACTHYPLIQDKIKKYLPKNVDLLSQGSIVAKGLKDYLQRHPEIEKECSKNKLLNFYTTDLPETFDKAASLFYGEIVKSQHLDL